MGEIDGTVVAVSGRLSSDARLYVEACHWLDRRLWRGLVAMIHAQSFNPRTGELFRYIMPGIPANSKLIFDVKLLSMK